MNKNIAIIIFLLAYGLLYPGLTLPMLTIDGIVERAEMAEFGKNIIVENPDTPAVIKNMAHALVENMEISGTEVVYESTRSIISTIRELMQNDHLLVAFLIGLFSIIVPLVKGLIIISVQLGLVARNGSAQGFNNLISKWSMADVFVIATFVAYLAANAVEKEAGLLSFDATLESGFYFFLAYCLLSIVATQIMVAGNKD